jgi:N-methylhydantoinase A/oxoprolinase/acetone carboxylase beta subunit
MIDGSPSCAAKGDGESTKWATCISADTGGTGADVVVAHARGLRAIGQTLTTPQRILDGRRAGIEVAAEEATKTR